MQIPKQVLSALHDLGVAELAHLNSNLASHLIGTYQRLQRWGSSTSVCMAGLYHAAYGTDGFAEQLVGLESRESISNVIGVEAETLVYIYAACDRTYFYPRLRREDRPEFKDRFSVKTSYLEEQVLRNFCELTIANELDVALPDLNGYIDKYGRYVLPLFGSDRFQSLLSSAAKQECIQYLLTGAT
jgi:hypothetical protein